MQYIEQKYQMEDENKEQYFRYYQTRAPTADSYSRKKQPFKRYNNSKILPHITEEYNYRITNYLLIKKIISPKRDKTIMQSLEALSRKYHSAHSKLNTASRDNFRRKTKLKSYENSRVEQNGSEFEHSFKQQPRAKTALKEGKIARRKLQKRKTETEFYQRSRITENKVQNNLYQTSQSQDRTSNSHSIKQSKEDQLLMISSNNNKWKQNYPLHGRCFKNHPTGYGNGPTVLLLTHLKIEINPPIKPQTLIQLQLIQRAAFTRSYLNVTCENTEKAVKADPFKYCELPKQGDSSSGIKFCIRLCKIGDFVPLRIWKYCGVQSILVGTIDLPLNTYSQQENEQSNKKIELVQKKDNELMFKRIFHGQVQHNLSKNKMLQTDSVALVKYKVYPKRFYRRQDKIIINQ